MHPDFADWYRRVDIEPRADNLQKRWQAIEAFHQNVQVSDLTNATRVFFGLTPKDEGFLENYRNKFKATDQAFPMRGNSAELQVLAGATLASTFGEGDGWATAAALALVCGAVEGARKAPVPEIVDLARKTLLDQSAGLRAARKLSALPPVFDLGKEFQNLKNMLQSGGGNFQLLQGPLMEVLQPLLKAVAGITNWAGRAAQTEKLRQEESDILWWLFGESSRDLGVRFNKLKPPSGAIIGPKELAELIRILPGPYGAEAFLHKMLELAHPDLGDSASLADATLACPEQWLKGFVTADGLDAVADLCPVHLAAQKWLEAGGKKTAWYVPFQTASGFKPTLKLKPLSLSLQTYHECLLVRMFDQLKEPPDE